MVALPGTRNGLDPASRAHLAHVGEILVLPLGAAAREALDAGDEAAINEALAAIVAKLDWINDVLSQLGRRPIDMGELPASPPDVRLRLAVLHIATEIIAGR